MKIFKSIIPLLAVALAIFFIPACAAEPSVAEEEPIKEPEIADEPIEETEVKEAEKEPSTDVPGTSISLYPDAQLIYSDDGMIVYKTNASVRDLFDFYKDFSELLSGPASRTEEGFFLETELIRIIRNVPRDLEDQSAVDEYYKEIQDEISKSGRLIDLLVLQADSDEIDSAFDDAVISQLPRDGSILRFRFWTDD